MWVSGDGTIHSRKWYVRACNVDKIEDIISTHGLYHVVYNMKQHCVVHKTHPTQRNLKWILRRWRARCEIDGNHAELILNQRVDDQ